MANRQHQHLMAIIELGLIKDQYQRLALGREIAQNLAGERRHHRVRIDQRVLQDALEPLIAHVDTLGVPRQPGGQIPQVGAADIKHRRHQPRQIITLGFPLLGKKPLKFSGNSVR